MSATIHHDATAAEQFLKSEEELKKAHTKAVRRRYVYIHVVARVFIGALFLISGFAKLVNFSGTVEAMEAANIASPTLLLGLGIAIELAGGVAIAFGAFTRQVAIGLLAYLVAVTIIINGDLSVEMNRTMVVANIGIAGALLMLVSHGGGEFAFDTWRARSQAKQFAAH